jgi:hypothetical protein
MPIPFDMSITRATLDDIPQLADLLALLFEQETEFRPDREAQLRGLQAWLTLELMFSRRWQYPP